MPKRHRRGMKMNVVMKHLLIGDVAKDFVQTVLDNFVGDRKLMKDGENKAQPRSQGVLTS